MFEDLKRVTWLELFYDLAFVALVAQLTYVVADKHETFRDFFHIGLVGYMIFIAWLGTTIDRNQREEETLQDKLVIQLQMALAFVMSVSLPTVFEGGLTMFVLSFTSIRIIQIARRVNYYRLNPDRAPKTHNLLQGYTVAVILWLLSAFTPLPYGYVLSGCALILDILTPITTGKGNKMLRLNLSHLQERLGLFLILVIGESMLVVALANTVAEVGASRPLIVVAGIIMMIALWWTYFEHLDKCGEGRRPTNMPVYLHAHAFLFGGVVLIAAAFKNILKHSDFFVVDHVLLTIGVFLVSLTLILIRGTLENKAMFRTGAVRIMTIGVPIVGYLGYYTGDIVKSVILMSLWVVIFAAYDEYRREKLSK